MNTESDFATPKSLKILNKYIKYNLFSLYLIFITIFIGLLFFFLRWNTPLLPFNSLFKFFFISSLIFFYFYLLIFFNKRSIFYLNKKIRRAKLFIIILAILTIPILIASLSFIMRAHDLTIVMFFPPIVFLALALFIEKSFFVLISLFIAFTPSFGHYLDSSISHKKKENLGASGYWMSRTAEYINYAGIAIFFIIFFVTSIIDLSGISCFGIIRPDYNCYISKVKTNNDISLCENTAQSKYCYTTVLENSGYNFDLCANAVDNNVSTKCFDNFTRLVTDESFKIDANSCEHMKSSLGKDKCYSFFATKKKSINLCDAITNLEMKGICKSRFDPSICIPESPKPGWAIEDLEDCYYRKAVFLQNPTLCEKIDSYKRNGCYVSFAIYMQDPTLCENIDDKYDNYTSYTDYYSKSKCLERFK